MKSVVKVRGVGRVTLDLTKLRQIQAQAGKRYVTQVGVLGSKAGTRQEGNLTNAEIGIIHEKGSISGKIPRRSFIEMPLTLKLSRYIRAVGQKIVNGLTKENLKKSYRDLGILAERIIDGAFSSAGFGRWPENTPSTIKNKGSSRPLIDTAQLRKSIASRVVNK